jgi:DHA2 family multidrug resistance protein-like MFS transporter
LLPEYRDPDARKPDVPSALLSLTAVLSAIYGLKRISQDGVSLSAIAFIVVGLGIGTAFIRRQQKLADPLIDLQLFHIPEFRASLVLYGGCILVLFGGFLFMPQYLQLVLGLSPLAGGLWTMPWSIGFVLGTLATPALARRVKPSLLMSGGLVLSSFAYVLIARLGTSTADLPMFAAATFILSLGASPLFTLTNDIIIGSAPPERAGAASGISETCAEFGGALGIAIFGSIGVTFYRGLLGNHLPIGLPSTAVDAAMATLGGAVATAQELPKEVGSALVHAARDAFLRGLVICAVISGVGSLFLAVFAARTFRSVAADRAAS